MQVRRGQAQLSTPPKKRIVMQAELAGFSKWCTCSLIRQPGWVGFQISGSPGNHVHYYAAAPSFVRNLSICFATMNFPKLARLQPKRITDGVVSVLTKIFPWHHAAWRTAYSSIDRMINASSDQERARLSEQWRRSMLTQLSNVEVIVCRITRKLHPMFLFMTEAVLFQTLLVQSLFQYVHVAEIKSRD